jgi:integrase/recombinase XerD
VSWSPCLVRDFDGDVLVGIRLGHPLVDRYLSFVGARLRLNSWLAVAFDLKVFFDAVRCDPCSVTSVVVFDFLETQRAPRRGGEVVRLEDGEQGLSARTIRRRLSSIAGFYDYLVISGVVASNPVPRGSSRRHGKKLGLRGRPLIRAPRTLPQILSPEEVDRFYAVLRSWRDRAMIAAMVFGGLRRCEVLGLRLEDIRPGERQVFIADGKGGHQRQVPVASRFFTAVASYLDIERAATEANCRNVFVVLKGPRRGLPLSAAGLDQIVEGARDRAGLPRVTCHQLRHTCLTRLREAGMALEAVQAQAGHRSIESTRIYLHLSNRWLLEEYHSAADAIDADAARLLNEADLVTGLGEA